MSHQVNVALIGSKFMGRAHSNAWGQVGRFFDTDPSPLMHTVVARNPPSWPRSLNLGLDECQHRLAQPVTDPEIDLVDIGTPNNVHAEAAIAALDAGKHVACEKPLAGTLADAEAMAARQPRPPVAPSSGTTTAACRPWRLLIALLPPGRSAGSITQGCVPAELGWTRHSAAVALPG